MTGKELGLLEELALRQETYRGYLEELREAPDRTFAEATIASEGMDADVLIACATVLYELSHDNNRDTTPEDILWAQEFVDHLDTLGFEVRPKFHPADGHNEGMGHFGN